MFSPVTFEGFPGAVRLRYGECEAPPSSPFTFPMESLSCSFPLAELVSTRVLMEHMNVCWRTISPWTLQETLPGLIFFTQFIFLPELQYNLQTYNIVMFPPPFLVHGSAYFLLLFTRILWRPPGAC